MAPHLPLVKIDSGLVEQAVGNLIENAVRYTPPQTTIEVCLSLSVSTLVIVVQDEGRGFPPEAIPHLFEKFYRVPGTATGGTGLGLSISKGLIESMLGNISVENRPGGGAIFTIRLPVMTRPSELEDRHG